MDELTLTQTQVFALRSLMGAEPVEGEVFPTTTVLDQISRLIPCDAIGAAVGGSDGYVISEVSLPRDYLDGFGAPCDGPWYIGLLTFAQLPEEQEWLAALGVADELVVGFRTGRDKVAQIWLDRRTRRFTRQDVSLLSLISPVLQRLVREATTQPLPTTLTLAERRVLQHVAIGLTNEQIAGRLFVAPSTVRKHLQNAYRKLGVTNRLSAVARFQGQPVADVLELGDQQRRINA
jgi:DNA-binding CsgD family transcriptional regulator